MEYDNWQHFDNGDSIIIVNVFGSEEAEPGVNVYIADKNNIKDNTSIYNVMVELHEETNKHKETN